MVSERRVRPFDFLFLDSGGFSDLLAQVVKAAASDDASLTDLNALDAGTVQKEGLLDANPVSDATDGDRLGRAAALANDDDAFEHLSAFFAALDDFGIDFYRIPGSKLGDGLFKLIAIEDIDDVHTFILSGVEGLAEGAR
jgi:hypothetical protein